MTTWNPGSELKILKWFLGFQSLGKISGYSLGAKFWKLLRFEFCCTLVEKLIIVPDINYITSAIRKLMLDTLSPRSFQNICLLIWAQQSSGHVKPCDTNWVKIKGAQLKVSLHHSVVHQMLIKNCKITMIIWCILTEFGWNVKFMKNVYVSICQHFLRSWSCNNLVRKHHITIVLYNIWSVFNAVSVCATWFLIQILSFLPDTNQMVHIVWTLLASKYLAPGL